MKVCRICPHPERGFIDALLEQGLSPRALAKRIGSTTRKSLAYHRDACLARPPDEKETDG